jgi:hypothetical protein
MFGRSTSSSFGLFFQSAIERLDLRASFNVAVDPASRPVSRGTWSLKGNNDKRNGEVV